MVDFHLFQRVVWNNGLGMVMNNPARSPVWVCFLSGNSEAVFMSRFPLVVVGQMDVFARIS